MWDEDEEHPEPHAKLIPTAMMLAPTASRFFIVRSSTRARGDVAKESIRVRSPALSYRHWQTVRPFETPPHERLPLQVPVVQRTDPLQY
jgi:hypothetical protein